MTIAALGDGWFGNPTARARLRRDGEDLVVESFEHDGDEARDAFLDALSGMVTTTSRLVDEGGQVLRKVEVSPVAAPTPFTLARLEEAIRASWSAETSDKPVEWTEENPSFQQCDVTARVVQDYLGGEILVTGVVLDGRRVDRHAWNRLPSGLEIDLTREQFLAGEQFEAAEVLTEHIDPKVHTRYEALAARVRAKLNGGI